MSPKRSYRSFLLRCWTTEERDSIESLDERFVVERISDDPHRWVFSTFADLVEFLHAELLGEEPGGQQRNTPPDA